MYFFLIRSVKVFYEAISPVYVVSIFVIVMWLYSLSFMSFSQNPFILGPTHPPSLKWANVILEPKLSKITH